MFIKFIVRDDVKSVSGETTDAFLKAVESIFYSPIYEIKNEAEIENLKNAYVASCTKIRHPMVQEILDKTFKEL